MDKHQKICKKQCLRENCINAKESRCKIYWGQKCNRLGGSKIPRMIPKYEFVLNDR